MHGKICHIRPFYRSSVPRMLLTENSYHKSSIIVPRSDMENVFCIMKEIVFKLDKLEGLSGPSY